MHMGIYVLYLDIITIVSVLCYREREIHYYNCSQTPYFTKSSNHVGKGVWLE